MAHSILSQRIFGAVERSPFRGRLWPKHALIAVLISLLVVALAGVALQLEKQRYRERATVATRNIARLLDQQISGVLGKIDIVLQTSSNSYVDMTGSSTVDTEKLNQSLTRQASLVPEIASLRIADKNGIVRFGTTVPESPPVNLSDRDYFRMARESSSNSVIVVGPIFARITQAWVMVLARRINAPDGSFAGVVYANLLCDHFEEILSLASLGPHGAATIRTADLALVHRFPDTKNAIGSRDVSMQLRDVITAHPEGGEYIAVTKLDGVERSNAFRLLKYPLYVIVGSATEDYLGAWKQNAFLISCLAGITLLITWISIIRIYLGQCKLNDDIEKRTQIASALEHVVAERRQLYTVLENQKNELEQANATLEQKVAERTVELSKVNQALERVARRDALTGLGNRLSTDEHLHEEFLRMKRTAATYSILLIDIDHFKRVNDTFGHEQGDKVLKHVARTLNHACRSTDFVGRFGGEEFLAILPNTIADDAIVVAEKMREAVAVSEEPMVGKVTVSIGAAEATPGDHEETDALRLADKNLYRAKANGRNQVIGNTSPCSESY